MTEPEPRPPRAGGRPRMPRAGDPYGVGAIPPLIAPILSMVGLVLVAILTVSLLNGQVPFLTSKPGTGNGNGNGNGNGGPARTPAPSNVVIVDPEVTFKGSIVYAKAGNIWVQDADGSKQVTSSGGDSMPSWSSDGQWIYYIRTTDQETDWNYRGGPVVHYLLQVPDLMRVRADGSADPERLETGKFKRGRYSWSFWMRQPVLSPDGSKVALVTDAPNPENSNVVLQFFDMKTEKITRAGVAEIGILGHQDPEWRPDGKFLLYVKNGRDGAKGAPIIVRYDPATRKTKALTAAGYVSPSYSPDGRYMAATRTSNLGTDVVILDANSGLELLRVTNDGASFSPSWSPAGDGIAFLHLVGQTVDLQLARLDGAGGAFAVKDIIDLTEVSGLDASSRPDWFIPAGDLPAPTPTPTPAATPSSAAPSASPSP